MLAVAQPGPARELLYACDVDAVDARAVVGEEGGERAPDDFTPVDDEDVVPEEPVAVGQDRVVDV